MTLNQHVTDLHFLRWPQFDRPTQRGARLDEPDLQVNERSIRTLNGKGLSMRNQDVVVFCWFESLPDLKPPLLDLEGGGG